MKYQCPICKNIHEGKVDACPKCGIKFKYANENINQKYVCPECHTYFFGQPNFCPECGIKFKYRNVELETKQEVKEETPNLNETPVSNETPEQNQEVVEEVKEPKKKKSFAKVFFKILLALVIILLVLAVLFFAYDVLAGYKVIPANIVSEIDKVLEFVKIGKKPLLTSTGLYYNYVVRVIWNFFLRLFK